MAIPQTANTIILEMGNAKKDDLDDLRYGEGKIFKRIQQVVEQLKEAGEVQENAQPIIVIVKQKKERSW